MKEGAMWARGLMKHFSLTARLRFAYAELTALFRINFGNLEFKSCSGTTVAGTSSH